MADAFKVLAALDIQIGVIVFILQGVFYGLGYRETVVFASTGFWGGLIFITTGSYLLRRRTRNLVILGLAIASLFSAFIIISLFSWGITHFYGGYCGEECDEYAIEIIFLVSGILMAIVNIVVIVKAKNMPAFITPLQTHNEMQTVSVINTAQQPYQVSDTALVNQEPAQQQQYPVEPGDTENATQYPTPKIYQVQQMMWKLNESSVNYQLPPTVYQPNQLSHPNDDEPPTCSKL